MNRTDAGTGQYNQASKVATMNECKIFACMLVFYLAGCGSLPRNENSKEEALGEVSVGFVEIYDAYQNSFGVELTEAQLERNSDAAFSAFRSEIERAASLQISNDREKRRLLERTHAAAKDFLESQVSPANEKTFTYWLAAQVLNHQVGDAAQLKFAFTLLSDNRSTQARSHVPSSVPR